jgi:hypothetical protein
MAGSTAGWGARAIVQHARCMQGFSCTSQHSSARMSGFCRGSLRPQWPRHRQAWQGPPGACLRDLLDGRGTTQSGWLLLDCGVRLRSDRPQPAPQSRCVPYHTLWPRAKAAQGAALRPRARRRARRPVRARDRAGPARGGGLLRVRALPGQPDARRAHAPGRQGRARARRGRRARRAAGPPGRPRAVRGALRARLQRSRLRHRRGIAGPAGPWRPGSAHAGRLQ